MRPGLAQQSDMVESDMNHSDLPETGWVATRFLKKKKKVSVPGEAFQAILLNLTVFSGKRSRGKTDQQSTGDRKIRLQSSKPTNGFLSVGGKKRTASRGGKGEKKDPS